MEKTSAFFLLGGITHDSRFDKVFDKARKYSFHDSNGLVKQQYKLGSIVDTIATHASIER